MILYFDTPFHCLLSHLYYVKLACCNHNPDFPIWDTRLHISVFLVCSCIYFIPVIMNKISNTWHVLALLSCVRRGV